jgi:hypothetical protein
MHDFVPVQASWGKIFMRGKPERKGKKPRKAKTKMDSKNATCIPEGE